VSDSRLRPGAQGHERRVVVCASIYHDRLIPILRGGEPTINTAQLLSTIDFSSRIYTFFKSVHITLES